MGKSVEAPAESITRITFPSGGEAVESLGFLPGTSSEGRSYCGLYDALGLRPHDRERARDPTSDRSIAYIAAAPWPTRSSSWRGAEATARI